MQNIVHTIFGLGLCLALGMVPRWYPGPGTQPQVPSPRYPTRGAGGGTRGAGGGTRGAGGVPGPWVGGPSVGGGYPLQGVFWMGGSRCKKGGYPIFRLTGEFVTNLVTLGKNRGKKNRKRGILSLKHQKYGFSIFQL